MEEAKEALSSGSHHRVRSNFMGKKLSRDETSIRSFFFLYGIPYRPEHQGTLSPPTHPWSLRASQLHQRPWGVSEIRSIFLPSISLGDLPYHGKLTIGADDTFINTSIIEPEKPLLA